MKKGTTAKKASTSVAASAAAQAAPAVSAGKKLEVPIVTEPVVRKEIEKEVNRRNTNNHLSITKSSFKSF